MRWQAEGQPSRACFQTLFQGESLFDEHVRTVLVLLVHFMLQLATSQRPRLIVGEAPIMAAICPSCQRAVYSTAEATDVGYRMCVHQLRSVYVNTAAACQFSYAEQADMVDLKVSR